MAQAPEESKGIPTETAVVFLLSAVAMLVPLAFTSALSDSFYLPKLTLLAGLVIIALTTLTGGRILAGRPLLLKDFRLRPLDVAVIIVAAIAVYSTFTAVNPALSFIGKYRTPEGLISILCYAGLYFAASRITWDQSRLRTVFAAAALGVAGVSAYAFLQAAGLDFVEWAQVPYSADRFGSTLGNPIQLAGYLAIASFTCIALVALLKSFRLRIVVIFALAFSVAGSLALSSGRAGILGLVVGLIGAALFARWAYGGLKAQLKMPLLVLVATAAVACATGIAAAQYVNSYGAVHQEPIDGGAAVAAVAVDSRFDASSARDRLEIWKSTPRLINDRAAVGWGPDSFELVYPAYQSLASAKLESAGGQLGRRAEDAHNVLLQTAATQGLPGLAAFFFLLAMVFYEGRGVITKKGPTQAPDMSVPLLGAFLLAGIVAFFISSQLTPVLSGSLIFFWLFAGIISSLRRQPEQAVTSMIDLDPQQDQSGVDFSRVAMLMVLLPVAGLLLILVLIPLGADMQYSEAEKAWQTGKIPAATEAYTNAMRINPLRDKYTGQFGQHLVQRGSVLGNLENVSAGTELLARAWEKSAYESTYPLALGIASLDLQGKDPQALSRAEYYLKEAARMAPNDARARYYLALTLLMQSSGPNDAAQLLSHLKRATAIAPDYFEAQKTLGTVYQLLGSEALALRAFRIADKLAPGDPQVTQGIRSLIGKKENDQ